MRGNRNMEDPAVQESIRRGPHRYVPGIGKHGAYEPITGGYQHQEYPKMMGKWPKPTMAQFKGKPEAERLLEEASREWDLAMQASIVNSKAEEHSWLKEHGGKAA